MTRCLSPGLLVAAAFAFGIATQSLGGIRLGPELEKASDKQREAYLQTDLGVREKTMAGEQRYALRQDFRRNLIDGMHARAEQRTPSAATGIPPAPGGLQGSSGSMLLKFAALIVAGALLLRYARGRNVPFSSADQNQFSKLKDDQSALKTENESLGRRTKLLSRKTARSGTDLDFTLSSAAQEIPRTTEELSKKASLPECQAEEAVLRHLAEKQMAPQQTAGTISEQAGHAGAGGQKTMRVAQLRGEGSSGTHSQPVKLPPAENKKPPVMFREELLKSLKESQPKVYEDIINKYYRRLTD
jgi:hypothetical protein